MKHFFTLVACCIFGFSIIAQDAKNSSIESKSVEIEKNNGHTKVTVTTRKNNERTQEVYEGAEAEEWIKENAPESQAEASKQTDISVSISKSDVESIKKEINNVQAELNNELENLARKLAEINVDSVMKDFGIEVYNTNDAYHFEMKTKGDDKKSVIVMKSATQNNEVNVDVEVKKEDNKTSKNVVVTKRSYMVEDNTDFDSKLKLDQLVIYPNPGDEVLKVDFVSNSTDNVTLEFSNAHGALVSILETSGRGAKNLVIDLNDLPAGVYYLTMKQNGKALHKKLMIQ